MAQAAKVVNGVSQDCKGSTNQHAPLKTKVWRFDVFDDELAHCKRSHLEIYEVNVGQTAAHFRHTVTRINLDQILSTIFHKVSPRRPLTTC